ncbi:OXIDOREDUCTASE 2OG-FE II OXYGENASE FAMILY PROTEIN [Salix purpurea]|uniref:OXIDOREDUCTASE 2OG-FE II OXYGENASE FAMILY PROTEIN n=1 Tax=Salix purpurea TaxID=77065 RepID=A0A9Q0TKX2_SALPP|nr:OXIDOREDUCTASE 2OG-FE II OXYGENASE FAMILY PROTEIN [Salix purpurea]
MPSLILSCKQGNGVKGLSEIGLKNLPQQYIQPLEETINEAKIMPQASIPIIDMSELDGPAAEESVCRAAEKWGFFQIINHGVPTEVLENVKEATHRFFRLPAEEKRKYLKEFSPSNNVRFGTSFSPEVEKASEWKDYLSLFYVSEDEASALWPSVCRDQVLDYMRRSEIVIRRLLDVLMKNLKVIEIDGTKESLLIGPSDKISPLREVLASGEKAVYKEVLYSDYVKCCNLFRPEDVASTQILQFHRKYHQSIHLSFSDDSAFNF